ncbi:hypothetical protein [Dongia sp. agr-C8]
MSHHPVNFARGFQWAGSFVKLATYRGRPLSFRLSTQLAANCLAPQPGAIGPVQNVAANEPAIERACRRALQRLSHSTTAIELQRQDFDDAA